MKEQSFQTEMLLRDTDEHLHLKEQQCEELEKKYEEEFVENEELQKGNEKLTAQIIANNDVIKQIENEVMNLKESMRNKEDHYDAIVQEKINLLELVDQLNSRMEVLKQENLAGKP